MNNQESNSIGLNREAIHSNVAKYGIKFSNIKGANFMQIIPMRELKDTVEVERRCKEEKGPVFVTKNGYGCLVVMNIEYYNEIMESLEEAALINEGLKDVEQGRTVDGPTAIARLKEKHGL